MSPVDLTLPADSHDGRAVLRGHAAAAPRCTPGAPGKPRSPAARSTLPAEDQRTELLYPIISPFKWLELSFVSFLLWTAATAARQDIFKDKRWGQSVAAGLQRAV